MGLSDTWHAMRQSGNPAYHGLNLKDRTRAEYAYGIAKKTFGVHDVDGMLVPKGSAAYAEAKQKLREEALGAMQGMQ
jgi:hypothetical protein